MWAVCFYNTKISEDICRQVFRKRVGDDVRLWFPSYKAKRKVGRNVIEVRRFLFPSYFFLEVCNKEKFLHFQKCIEYIRDNDFYVNILGRGSSRKRSRFCTEDVLEKYFLTDEEVKIIRDLEEGKGNDFLKFMIGETVRVVSGVLEGREGKVLMVRGQGIVVELELLGRIVPITVDYRSVVKV